MTRFRLALWLSALTLVFLSGCRCCDKCSWFCKPCCQPAPSVVAPPIETVPYAPPATFGAGYYGPVMEAPVPAPGCNRSCGTPGFPASLGSLPPQGVPLNGAMTGPTFGNFPVISSPPAGAFPGGPIMTTPPTGILPGPTTVEPPPAGSMPRLDPVPNMGTPGVPNPARPVEADPTSRTRK